MPAHVKADPVEVSLIRFEAIVFVAKYLAHPLKQTLGLGKIGDGVRSVTTMYKTNALMLKNEFPRGLQCLFWHAAATASQLISADILVSQDLRFSTSRGHKT
jgi:hypothetical protein